MQRLIASLIGCLALAIVVSVMVTPSPEPEPKPFFVTNTIGAMQKQVSYTMECPADMPDCTRTARERYRKWLRGGYGWTRALRLHYGRSIRRDILRIAHRKWVRKYDRPFHRRREWREFRLPDNWYDNPRVCVAKMGFDYWNGDTSEYCRRRWYRDPARRFVKNVLVCAGQIALARIGTRGLAWKERATIVSGTGALCGWDKMP